MPSALQEEDDDDVDPRLLRHKNRELSVLSRRLKRKVASLRSELQSAERQRLQSLGAASCLRRGWDQLEEGLAKVVGESVSPDIGDATCAGSSAGSSQGLIGHILKVCTYMCGLCKSGIVVSYVQMICVWRVWLHQPQLDKAHTALARVCFVRIVAAVGDPGSCVGRVVMVYLESPLWCSSDTMLSWLSKHVVIPLQIACCCTRGSLSRRWIVTNVCLCFHCDAWVCWCLQCDLLECVYLSCTSTCCRWAENDISPIREESVTIVIYPHDSDDLNSLVSPIDY
jgi:hypothetical protein